MKKSKSYALVAGVQLQPGQHCIDGFPFDEGWPPDHENKIYKIILRDGTHRIASVDTSTQYRAEGTMWRSTDGCWHKNIVAGWCEIPKSPSFGCL